MSTHELSQHASPQPGGIPQRSSRVISACKALIREINRRGLGPGGMLPSQAELRRQLRYSNDTLTEAMRILKDQGVLMRKRHVGTVITDPDRLPRGLFTIGLATPRFDDAHVGATSAVLTGLIQSRLSQFGCHSRVYPHRRSMFLKEKRDPVNGFDGLAEDVNAGLVDAVITPYAIDADVCWHWFERGLLIAQTAMAAAGPASVCVDMQHDVKQALEMLNRVGVRRPALVVNGGIPLDERHRILELIQKFTTRFRGASHQAVYVAQTRSLIGGQEVADQLLRTPARDRPDGLIILDDYQAIGLATAMVEMEDYRPEIVVNTARENPLAYALPVMRLQASVAERAEAIMDMTLAVLRNPSIAPQRRIISARVADPVARRIPLAEPGTPSTARASRPSETSEALSD